MYSRLVALCTHKNKKVQYAAFPALKAFFKQVANELVADTRAFESNKETFKVKSIQLVGLLPLLLFPELTIVFSFQFFIKKFFELVDGQTGGVTEISIGICGFGQFAAPIQMFLGTYELKKMLNKLFLLSERYISRFVPLALLFALLLISETVFIGKKLSRPDRRYYSTSFRVYLIICKHTSRIEFK